LPLIEVAESAIFSEDNRSSVINVKVGDIRATIARFPFRRICPKLSAAGGDLRRVVRCVRARPPLLSAHGRRQRFKRPCRSRRVEEALRDLNQALIVGTSSEFAYLGRADIYRRLSRNDDALADYDKRWS
jgi:hypothetical protein